MSITDKIVACFEQRERIVRVHGVEAFENELAHWTKKLDKEFEILRESEERARAYAGWRPTTYATAYEIVRGEG